MCVLHVCVFLQHRLCCCHTWCGAKCKVRLLGGACDHCRCCEIVVWCGPAVCVSVSVSLCVCLCAQDLLLSCLMRSKVKRLLGGTCDQQPLLWNSGLVWPCCLCICVCVTVCVCVLRICCYHVWCGAKWNVCLVALVINSHCSSSLTMRWSSPTENTSLR